MVVENYMNVLGRGWVIIAYGEELSQMEVNCGGKIVRGDTVFTIKGVERTKYDDKWWDKRVGLILSPNVRVPDYFDIDDELVIINELDDEQKER